MSGPRDIGAAGESLARAYLESLGYTTVGSNVRVGHDEIDLLMRDGNTLVFVEVKQRSGGRSGLAAVDAAKRRRISRAAVVYMAKQGIMGCAARFDVIEVCADGETRTVHHIPNAFPLVSGRYFV